MSPNRIARELVAEGRGILAADESTATITKRLESFGVGIHAALATGLSRAPADDARGVRLHALGPNRFKIDTYSV